MRKINLLLIGVFLFLSSCNVFAQVSFTEDNITYTVTGANSVTVTGHTITSNTDLDIPSDVTHNEVTYIVEHIGDEAFKDCEYLTSVTLPSSILSVGTSAFAGCENLTMLTHNGEGTIGDYAFDECFSLSTVILSDLVTYINSGAFFGCSIDNITFSKGLTMVGWDAFFAAFDTGIGSLTITIRDNVTNSDDRKLAEFVNELKFFSWFDDEMQFNIESDYFSTDAEGNLYNADKTKLIYAWIGCLADEWTTFNIPSSVTTIGYKAFEYVEANSNTWVNVPATVTAIEDSAFCQTTIENITFAEKVTPQSLGNGVFYRNPASKVNLNFANETLRTTYKAAWTSKVNDYVRFRRSSEILNNTPELIIDDNDHLYINLDEQEIAYWDLTMGANSSLECSDWDEFATVFDYYNNTYRGLGTFMYEKQIPLERWSLVGNLTSRQSENNYYSRIDAYGLDTQKSHFFAASPFDYTTNAWSTSYAVSTDNTPDQFGAFFIYPFKAFWENTDTHAQTGESDENVVLIYSMEYQHTNYPVQLSDVYFSKTNKGTNDGSGKWFVLSNPFIGRLNLNKFKTTNNARIQGNLIYVWNSDAGTVGDWEAYDLSEGTYAVLPATGFMVASNGGSSSLSVALKTSDIVTTESLTAFKSTEGKIKFFAQTNDVAKIVSARYNQEATNGFDANDSYKMVSADENSVDPYFFVEGNSIADNWFNSLPYITDINFHSYKDNEVEFSCQNSNPDIEVSIIDIQNNNSETVLNNGEVFNISCSEGDNAGRYKIKFARKNVGINEVASEDNSIQIWNNAREVTIDGKDLRRVEIYNTLGQMVYSSSLAGNSTTFDSNLNDGAYIIKAYTSNSSKSKKVIIK